MSLLAMMAEMGVPLAPSGCSRASLDDIARKMHPLLVNLKDGAHHPLRQGLEVMARNMFREHTRSCEWTVVGTPQGCVSSWPSHLASFRQDWECGLAIAFVILRELQVERPPYWHVFRYAVSDADRQLHREAVWLASELLMPAEVLQRWVRQHQGRVGEWNEEHSEYIFTGPAMMHTRCVALGLIPDVPHPVPHAA